MKIVDLECPRCGATLNANQISDNKVICSYCGNIFLIQEDDKENQKTKDKPKQSSLPPPAKILLKPSEQDYASPQKQSVKATIILPIVISLLMLIFGGIFSLVGSYLDKKNRQITQKNIVKNKLIAQRYNKQTKVLRQKRIKEQKFFEKEHNKEWFSKNISIFPTKDFNKIKKTLIKLNIPTFGSKNPDLEIYNFIWAYYLKKATPKIQRNENLIATFSSTSITYLPITNQNIIRSKGDRAFYNMFFEALLERSSDGFLDVMHTIRRLPSKGITPAKYYNLLICDKQAMKLAINKNLHKNKIKKLQHLIRKYNIVGKEYVFVKNNKTNQVYRLSPTAIYYWERSIKLILNPKSL